MEIKVFISLAVFATILASVHSEDDFIVEVLSPRGFRVSTENFPGIQRVGFRGNINTELLRHENAEYTGDFSLHSNDWWVYENPTASLSPGDTLYYRPQILSRTSGVLSFVRQFYVPIDTPLISNSGNDVEHIEDDVKPVDEEPNTAQQFDGTISSSSNPNSDNYDVGALNENPDRIEDESQPLNGEVNGDQQLNGSTEFPSTSTGLYKEADEGDEYGYDTEY